jgi:hypothetical protein
MEVDCGTHGLTGILLLPVGCSYERRREAPSHMHISL